MYSFFLRIISCYFQFTDALKLCYLAFLYKKYTFDETRSFAVQVCPEKDTLQYLFQHDDPYLRYVHYSDTMTVIRHDSRNVVDVPSRCRSYFMYVSYNNVVQIQLPARMMLVDNKILSYLFVRHYMNVHHNAIKFDKDYILTCIDTEYNTFTLDRTQYVRLNSVSYTILIEDQEP